jgi:tRNA1(Val) A37 N6-methylase TrmN6
MMAELRALAVPSVLAEPRGAGKGALARAVAQRVKVAVRLVKLAAQRVKVAVRLVKLAARRVKVAVRLVKLAARRAKAVPWVKAAAAT